MSIGCVCLFLFTAIYCTSAELHRLYDDLFADYECSAYPGPGTQVKLQMVVLGLMETQSSRSELLMKMNLRQTWYDNRISWDPENYSNISIVSLDSNPEFVNHCVWVPDLQVVNNVLAYSDLIMTGTNVFPDGRVYQAKLGNIRSMLRF